MSGNGYTGTVIGSGTGTGPYQMTLNNAQTVQATAIGVDSSESVPIGTVAVVIKINNGYYFQPNVFAPGGN